MSPIFLFAAALTATPAQAAETRLTATLTPTHADAMQGHAGAGQPGASGSFAARIDPATGELCYALSLTGVPDVTMAHIHTIAAAPDGPQLVTLLDFCSEPGPGETCQPIGPILAIPPRNGEGDHPKGGGGGLATQPGGVLCERAQREAPGRGG